MDLISKIIKLVIAVEEAGFKAPSMPRDGKDAVLLFGRGILTILKTQDISFQTVFDTVNKEDFAFHGSPGHQGLFCTMYAAQAELDSARTAGY